MSALKEALRRWNKQLGRIPVVFDGLGEVRVIGDIAPSDFLYPDSTHTATHALLAEQELPARLIQRGVIGDQFYVIVKATASSDRPEA